jgi:hypothetical protein
MRKEIFFGKSNYAVWGEMIYGIVEMQEFVYGCSLPAGLSLSSEKYFPVLPGRAQ